MTFRITPEAVEYIRLWLKEELVLTFVPSMPVAPLWPAEQSPPSPEDMKKLAREAFEKLPRRLVLRWEVGGTEKVRLPPEECRIVDGIEVHLPAEIESSLASRVLKLEKGELVLEPPLEPLDVERPDWR